MDNSNNRDANPYVQRVNAPDGGTDDLREAPSIENIEILLDEGAKIKVYDPKAMNNLKALTKKQHVSCEKCRNGKEVYKIS